MTIDLEGREIFIASPSGLEEEREVIRSTVDTFNRTYAIPKGVTFILRGWEESAAGIGRPQSQINEILDPCDYLVVLLADRWGSNPGGGQFASGTEEEFMRAVELRGSETANMRDIHVLFRSVPPERQADPGPELSKVLAFKQKLQDGKQLLYSTFDTSDSLRLKIEGNLRKWSEPLEPRTVEDIALTDSAPSSPVPVTNVLQSAIELAAQGSLVRAEVLFSQASESKDPHALTEFARFARRQGRLEDATRLNMEVVESLSRGGRLGSEESAYLADALANIGVIARKQGDLTRSLASLRDAIVVAKDSPAPLSNQLTYALDNLGHSLSQLNQYDKAREAFLESKSIRDANGAAEDRNISLMNLGWLELRVGAPDSALPIFEDAERGARTSQTRLQLASALTGRAKALFQLGSVEDALPLLVEALEINRSAGSSDGVSMVSGLLARGYAALGETAKAETAIAAVLRESELSGNVVGTVTALWAQALVSRSEQKDSEATEWFVRALDLARSTGNAALYGSIESSRSQTSER